MNLQKTEGLIFRAANIFEKDKLIEVFSYDYGRIKVLAKYANTAKFRFGGRLWPFNFVSICFTQKNSFKILQEINLIKNFTVITSNFNKMTLAGYFINLIQAATVFDQPNAEIFALLLESFKALNNKDENDLVKFQQFFQRHFLLLEGLAKSDEIITEEIFKFKMEQYTNKKIVSPRFI